MRARLAILITTLAVVTAIPGAGAAQDVRAASPLRVGAAKVDVTPADSALPKNYLGVLDRLYARAIVLENGAARAALITVDAGGLSDAIWQAVTRQVETELRDSVSERVVDGDAYAQRARTAGEPTTQRRSWTPCGARSRS